MAAGMNYYIIEGGGDKPQTQYDYPANCRHCGCTLNMYNPADACYCCQEAGKESFSREKKIQPEEKITLEEALKILRSGSNK